MASLLDEDLSAFHRQPTIPSSFTEFEAYTQRKSQVPSQMSPCSDSPMLCDSIASESSNPQKNIPDSKSDESIQLPDSNIKTSQDKSSSAQAEKLTTTPIYDLSRPITGQCLQEQISSNVSEKLSNMRISGSESVPMEIPCKSQSPAPGDFTLLGMEFETVSEVCTNVSKKTQKVPHAGAGPNSDFKFVKKEDTPDCFDCSQLDIPFSQLDGRFEGSQSATGMLSGQLGSYSQEANSGFRLDSPSKQTLRARSYRVKAKISVSMII